MLLFHSIIGQNKALRKEDEMTKIRQFDLAVIGAGPGGYVAAIKASQMGKSVALIEKTHLGGTCLNVGCIPTKTLLASSQVLHSVKQAEQYGIETGPVKFHYQKMKERKDSVVFGIRKSLEGLIKTNGITILKGLAKFQSPHDLKILGNNPELIHAKTIIIATGSDTLDIPAFPCDHKRIVNSNSILEITELPKTLAVIGGGYIGCEFASLFIELGVKVTIVEALPSIIAMQGESLSDFLSKAFKKKGMKILTDTMVEKIDHMKHNLKLHFKNGESLYADMALVAIGRKLNTTGLAIENAGISLNDRGAINVNDKMATNVPGIYAIGDITGKAMLAHVASHQGMIAAVNACGGEAKMHYNAVPSVIFTLPEIAVVGLNVQEAKKKGLEPMTGRFPFQALGKSIATMHTEGFAEIVCDKNTTQILGAQVVGCNAATMIAEIALAITNELTLDCILETIHAHPTVSEAWLEAALIANDTPIHFPPKIRRP